MHARGSRLAALLSLGMFLIACNGDLPATAPIPEVSRAELLAAMTPVRLASARRRLGGIY